MKRVKVGVIGCGNISNQYFSAMKQFPILDLVACADLVKAKAEEKAAEHGIPQTCTVKQLLAKKDIEIIVNLTIPKAHAEIGMAALNAGKSVYGEKPLTITREEGQEMLDLARKKGLLVGNAPDTFLGAGHQTSRKLIDDGWIGDVVSGTCFMQCHGHESWHPDPEFYYAVGGGPLFDMGPYYLTALVNLLGPVRQVTSITATPFAERRITSQPKFGTIIPVETPTHIAGLLEFTSGAVITLVTSFDVWAHHMPCIELHGKTGSMSVPDPNGFGGEVKVFRPGQEGWAVCPHSHGYIGKGRGIGVADMAYALRTGREFRANGDVAFHVLDVMHALHEASSKGRHVSIKSRCKRPAAIPMDLPPFQLDE